MICFKYCLILIGLLHYTRRIYGQLAINVPEVGNYGEETHLNCTEASFNITNGYTWLKDNNKIYDTVNGDATNTGKYTSTHGTGFFTLTVADTVSNDDGEYTCKYNFNQQSSTLNIQAKGTVTAELSSSSSGKLEVTFQKIYPSEILVVITCDSIQEAGNFVSNETDGDRFNRKWESNKNFTSVPSDCSVQVTLVTIFPVPFVVKSVTLPPDGNQTSTPPTTPLTSIPTSTTSTQTVSSSTTSSAVVPNPATTPSSGNETTVIIVSSVVGGLFLIGIVITIFLMLLSQRKKHPSVKHSRKHHEQDRRQKRLYNLGYPTWQEHGQYNNTSYMEYPGMGTKMNPLYVPYRSAHRVEQNYSLDRPSANHQSYIRNHHLYYNSNMRPQTSMHSNQQRYYGERGGNNMLRSGLRKDENNYVTPDYEFNW